MSLLDELNKIKNKEYKPVSSKPTAMQMMQEARNGLDQLEKKVQKLPATYVDVALDFERQTALNKSEICLLFFGISLHACRIYFINRLFKIKNANSSDNTIEQYIKKIRKSVAKAREEYIGKLGSEEPSTYYAPLKQMYEGRGVPYDATTFDEDTYTVKPKPKIFKGANHRFSTYGHDPLQGLFWGTVNIITNTITVKPSQKEYENFFHDDYAFFDFEDLSSSVVDEKTYHVKYAFENDNYKDPRIADSASMSVAMALLRVFGDDCCDSDEQILSDDNNKENGLEVLIVALLKQLMHTASDLFTPVGIQLPFAMNFLDKKCVEEITKKINTGDFVKIGIQVVATMFCNLVIGLIHKYILYKWNDKEYNNLVEIKTNKIVGMSNLIASSSSVISSAMKAYSGDILALKQADIGGMIIAIKKIYESEEFKNKIMIEYMSSELSKRILEYENED